MKQLLFIAFALSCAACSGTTTVQDISEIDLLKAQLNMEREQNAKALQAMQQAQELASPEMPQSSLLTPRVCVSEPIFDVYGRYVRTTTRCQ